MASTSNVACDDYYKVLGVDRQCDEAALKKAYRRAAVKWHPDKWSSKSQAEQKAAEENFKRGAEAYDALSDPQKRAAYDRYGKDGSRSVDQGGSGAPHGDPEELFRQFFGGAMGGPRRDESSRGLAGAAGAGAGSGKAAGRRGGAAGAGGAMGAGGAATVATFVTSAAAARGSGESGAGPLPFFRLRRLRPLLPVVFCGIGRTADAPKGFAIPARPAPDGATTFLEKRCWRSSGVGRSSGGSS